MESCTDSLYTETLREYLENGNELPESFGLFVQTGYDFNTIFCAGREIGCETEALCGLKVKKVADVWVPQYVKIIRNYDSTLEAIKATVTKTTVTENLGETTDKSYDLPTADDVSGITPTGVAKSLPISNETVTSVGQTPSELEKKANWFTKMKDNAITSLLSKFENCFMQVF